MGDSSIDIIQFYNQHFIPVAEPLIVSIAQQQQQQQQQPLTPSKTPVINSNTVLSPRSQINVLVSPSRAITRAQETPYRMSVQCMSPGVDLTPINIMVNFDPSQQRKLAVDLDQKMITKDDFSLFTGHLSAFDGPPRKRMRSESFGVRNERQQSSPMNPLSNSPSILRSRQELAIPGTLTNQSPSRHRSSRPLLVIPPSSVKTEDSTSPSKPIRRSPRTGKV